MRYLYLGRREAQVELEARNGAGDKLCAVQLAPASLFTAHKIVLSQIFPSAAANLYANTSLCLPLHLHHLRRRRYDRSLDLITFSFGQLAAAKRQLLICFAAKTQPKRIYHDALDYCRLPLQQSTSRR